MLADQQLEEAISWRFMAELWRRFPKRFHLIEAHPGGGQYDCLVLITKGKDQSFAIDVNRGGSVHIHKKAFGLGGGMTIYSDWIEKMLLESPQRFLDEIAGEVRMRVPEKLPPSEPTTLVYRYIAEFLTHSIGRLEYWECKNGFNDTSGCGGGIRRDLFEVFPDLQNEEDLRRCPPILKSYAYNFWFLIKNGEPMFCLDTEGLIYLKSGAFHELPELYKRERRIWPLIHETVLDCLP